MSRLSCSVLILIASVALAQTPPEQTVEVTGEAAVVGKNALGAKDQAIEVALRRAVEQVCGTLVQSATLVENSQLVSDRIYTQAKGYVSKHEVLSGAEEKGVYTVKVKATVGTGKLSDDLAAIGLTLARKGLPRVAVLIVEQRVDDSVPVAWWTEAGRKAGHATVSQRIVESTLLGEWLKAGFSFVDPETVASGARVAGVLDGAPGESIVRQLGDKLSEADVIIVGNALAKKSQDLKALVSDSHGAKDLPGVSCTGTVTLRVLNADNSAELLAAGEESKTLTQLDGLTCGRAALVEATKTLGARLQKDLLAKWNAQLTAGNRVRVVIKGIDAIATYSKLKLAMNGELRGATVTGTPRYANGRADFDVMLKGSVDDAAAQIETWKLQGKKLKVSSMTGNTIEVEVTR
ncbi:MAG: flagellar assembly protein T N-terminal domain-containing protein [Archangium sp.]|nr:flagellar assembly protein T N-terminal domain-containing protein [Archangium sp.]